jgi:transcriptional regulator GlxA family with amidase domain
MEVLSHVSHNRNPEDPDRMFDIKTIACSPVIRAASSLSVQADIILPEGLEKIADFDILVVPGGPTTVLQPLLGDDVPELDLIRKFAALPQSPSGPRILFSVCTGAFLLGAAGVIAGKTVTTHHRGLDTLREICARSNDAEAAATTVVYKRYIDAGLLKGDNVRLITSGGISSGLDATCHIVRELASAEMASFVVRVMEYDWREISE